MDDPPYLKANTMISTHVNYIYQNIKIEYIQSIKLENVIGKVNGKSGKLA